MGVKIFISYRRTNQLYARLLYELLEKHGYKVFLDMESLDSGRFDEQLLRQIEKCNCFLLLLAPGALDRTANDEDWVRLEIEHALRYKKTIISVVDRHFRYPEALPESLKVLKNYQGIGTDTTDTGQLNFVVQQLANYLPKPRRWSKYLLLCLIPLLLVAFLLANGSTPTQPPPQPPGVEEPPPINGSNNTIKASNRTINGSNNKIYGDNNIIKGSNNNIYGNGNQIYGSNNKTYGQDNKFLAGSNNKSYSAQ